jgi:pimeloyl-ACP methyl ester carboxylesterase
MSYLINKKNQKIAYKAIKGKLPGIIFIHGLNSDMNGLKALSIEKYAKKNKIAFIRFDCRGHGRSHGEFENFTISDWREDVINVIDKLTNGPQILIGSSMGGWLMALAAKARPSKVSGLIGLAAAIDFGSHMYNSLSKKNINEIKKYGITKYSSYGFSYNLKLKFFVEAKKNNLLNKSFRFKKPVTLIQGMQDKIVDTNMPKKIMNIIIGNNIKIIYLKSSDHRLSLKTDLLLINNVIDNTRSTITNT